MAYVCYHALTDKEKVIVAKRFKEDLFASTYIQQDLADMLEIAQSTIAAWVNGRLLIPVWRAFTLQKKTEGVFRVERLRPDFVKAFKDEINTLAFDADTLIVGKREILRRGYKHDSVPETAHEGTIEAIHEKKNHHGECGEKKRPRLNGKPDIPIRIKH